MARYNEILVGRFNRFFQKLLSMKGGAVIPQLAGDIQPVFPLRWGVENHYLEGWYRYQNQFDMGPTVAQTEATQLRNPPGSNVIGVLEKVFISAVGGEVISAAVLTISRTFTDPGDLTNVFAGNPMDKRSLSNSAIVPSGSAGGSANLTITIGEIAVPAIAAPNVFNQTWFTTEYEQIPILPGTTVRFLQGSANSKYRLTLAWRERFLEDSERT